MSLYPYFGGIHRVPPTSYENGAPISAYRALALRNNIQFYVDQIGQHYNWTCPPSDEAGTDCFNVNTVEDVAKTQTWSGEIKHTWIRPDYPMSLDIKVVGFLGTEGGTDDLDVYVKVVPASAAPNDPSAPALFEAAATTTGAGTEAVVEGQAYFTSPIGMGGLWQELSVYEGGEFRAPRVAMSRIEVQLIAPGDNISYLLAVLVREFAWQTS